MASPVKKPAPPAADIAAIDWTHIAASLGEHGYAVTPALWSAEECLQLAALYERDELFRSHIIMARHSFGRGEYKYLRYPLPSAVDALRHEIYPRLASIAGSWGERLSERAAFPGNLDEFLAQCHAAGQRRPTPLMLKYGPGDYNCLHQDLYGDLVFPLQMTVLLSEPGVDFTGGEFVLVEQRPRMQSKVEIVPLRQGHAAIFAVHHRPVTGKRGAYRVNLRHGVSRVRSGQRFTLGVIFHDAA